MIETENPFSENWFSALASIKSIQLATNIDFLSLAIEPLSGENISLAINAESVAAHKVFSTGSAGIPSMRSLTRDDLPNDILASQIVGLDDTISTLVRTLDSASVYLTVSSNPQGDHTLILNTGTTAGTVAVGNDTRFPASVTGLRKGAGIGSADTAAVAKTDFWDTTTFVGSGASHAKGLVPDPGASAGIIKFLREDGSWTAPSGAGSVTSVGLIMPAEFAVSGSPITTAGSITVTRAVQQANKVYVGPQNGPPAIPTFRTIGAVDITTGVTAASVAIGNDTRFPASVTGMRKGAGVGSADVSAVAKTDYWDTTVFGASGLAHSKGLVPDPGAIGATTRFLCEDATFKAISVSDGSITNTMLAVMAGRRIKANATAGSASPTDVSAQLARTSALLNLESITAFGDVDYTATSTDKYVYSSATAFTANRRVTLPAANQFNPSQTITIADDSGSIQGFSLAVRAGGADTISGSAADLILSDRFSSAVFASNGNNRWNIINRSPSVRITVVGSGTTYTTPTGIKALYVEAIAGGGGGAGANAGGASNCAAGGGGAAGGYASVWINAPDVSYTFSIGAGGGAGAAANGTGGTGGNTTFGTVLAAIGGAGGTSNGGGTAIAVAGNAGLSVFAGSIGDITLAGGDGGNAYRLSGTVGMSGYGGGSRFGGSSVGPVVADTGKTRQNYGAGGSGALSLSATGFAGGAGRQGVILILELY